MFFEENAAKLNAFSQMSKIAGSRSDYVQGGGGNTSVKLGGGLMAIKASGFCLSDIEPREGYAVLDSDALRHFYHTSEPLQFDDVETAGAEQTKRATMTIEGLDTLRPSVEAGFHSILKTFVAHTHSVYANLATCTTACRKIAQIAFDGAEYSWGMVPYVDPGANLTFAIRDELRRVEKETGKAPSIILMQNHGIIAHDDDANTCLAIHADANERLAKHFGLTGDAFPKISVKEMSAGIFAADTPYLKEKLKNCVYSYDIFMEQPLYPDQMVFLVGTYFMNKHGISDGECVADTRTGEMLMLMPEKKALTMTETISAVLFIMEHIESSGYALSTMGEAAKHFIANWESEKYRKSLAAK